MTEPESHDCYIQQFPHQLPHRDEAKLRPCGHWACDPHTIPTTAQVRKTTSARGTTAWSATSRRCQGCVPTASFATRCMLSLSRRCDR